MTRTNLALTLAVTAAVGCATRLDQLREPQPMRTAGSAAVQPVSHAEPARSVALSGENTRVSFVGTAGPTSHEGSFAKLTGRIDLPSDDPKDARVRVEIDVASVYTKIDLLSAHLRRADMFDAASFPTATFETRRVEAVPTAEGSHVVTGDFTIHGVTRSLTFPARPMPSFSRPVRPASTRSSAG